MAENTDGSIIFDTALDNTGFKKGSAKMESAVKSLVGSVNNLGKKIDTGFSNGNAVLSFTAKLYDAQTRAAELQAMLAQLGSQQIATQQYTDLSKQIERAEKSLLGLYDRRDAMQDAGVSEYSKEWKALEKQIQKAEIQLEGFENKRALMVENGEAFVSGADTEEYARTKAILEQTQIELENSRRLVASEALEQARLNVQAAQEKVIRAQTAEELARAKAELAAAQAELRAEAQNVSSRGPDESQIGGWERFGNVIGGAASASIRLASAVGKVGFSALSKGVRTAISSLKKYITNVKKTVTQSNALVKSLTSIKTLLKTRIKRMFISAFFTEAKEGINDLARFSSEFNNAMSNIKNRAKETSANLSVSLGGFIQAIEPGLTLIINALSTALTYLNSFFAMLGGKNTVIVAKKQTDSYADSLDGAASSAEELKNQVYGFDQLNKRNSTSNSSGGSNAADKFEEVPIDSLLPDEVQDYFDRLYDAIIGHRWEEAGYTLASGLDSLLNTVDRWIDELRVKGPQWAENFGNFINGIAENKKMWGHLGWTLSNGLNVAFDTVYTFLTTTKFAKLGEALSTALLSMLENTHFDKIGATIGAFLRSKIQLAWGFLTDFTDHDGFKKAGDSIAKAINGFFDEMSRVDDYTGLTGWQELGQDIALTANGLIDMIVTALHKINWGEVKDGVFSAIEEFWETSSTGTKTALILTLSAITIGKIGKVLVTKAVLDTIIKKFGTSVAGAFGGSTAAGAGGAAAVGTSIFAWIAAGLTGAVAGGAVGELVDHHIIAPIMDALGKSDLADAYENFSWLGTGPGSLFDTVTGWLGIGEEKSQAAVNLANSNKQLISALNESGRMDADSANSYFTQVKDIMNSDMSSTKQIEALSELNDKLLEIAETATQSNDDMATSTSETQLTLKEKYDLMISELGDAADDMIVEVERPTEAAKQAGEEMNVAVEKSLTDATKTAKNESTKTKNEVTNLWNSLKMSANSSWQNIGNSLVAGLKAGISNAWNSLKSTVGTLAQGLTDKLKSVFQIRSPSHAWEDIGRLDDKGLENGIVKNKPRILKAVSNLASDANNALADSNPTLDITADNNSMVTQLSSIADKLASIAASFRAIDETLVGKAQLQIPLIASGREIPYRTKIATTPTTLNSPDYSGYYDGIDEQLSDSRYLLKQIIELLKHLNINIDIDALTQAITKQQRERSLNFGGV